MESYYKILHTSYPFTLLNIWKVLLHYPQSWQNYTAFRCQQPSSFDFIKNCHN